MPSNQKMGRKFPHFVLTEVRASLIAGVKSIPLAKISNERAEETRQNGVKTPVNENVDAGECWSNADSAWHCHKNSPFIFSESFFS